MRLFLAFGLGAGCPGGASHKEDPPVRMLESRGQAGLLTAVYCICRMLGWGLRFKRFEVTVCDLRLC